MTIDGLVMPLLWEREKPCSSMKKEKEAKPREPSQKSSRLGVKPGKCRLQKRLMPNDET